MPTLELGETIPANASHTVSVSLPTWKSNVGYEEGEEWVLKKMVVGYPRFVIHHIISAFARDLVRDHGRPGQTAMLFPSQAAAQRCAAFVRKRTDIHLDDCLDLVWHPHAKAPAQLAKSSLIISAVFLSPEIVRIAKEYWQHMGDGCSSRQAEFCHELYRNKLLVPRTSGFDTPENPQDQVQPRSNLPPSNAVTTANPAAELDMGQCSHFIEKRLPDLVLAKQAESTIKRRIATVVNSGLGDPASLGSSRTSTLNEDDVFLFPGGMNALFNAHRALLRARGSFRCVNYGFPYVDMLKLLEKFGPGCIFLGHASASELAELEALLLGGERIVALFCEFPGNPLMTCPDLARIRALAHRFDFPVVVDDTIGGFANINVLQFADIVVSSLTKLFSGSCNVMGGSLILNPDGRYHHSLKEALEKEAEDNYWPEDVAIMEKNSRDYCSRSAAINANAEAIYEIIKASPAVKEAYYPKDCATRNYYEACRLSTGGYGGLISVVFHSHDQAVVFHDTLDTAKGPSFGTNFTLASPHVVIALYTELDWAAKYGVDRSLVRISIGLEERQDLEQTFQRALEQAESVK